MKDLSTTSWILSAFLHGALVALMVFGPSLRPTMAPSPPVGNVMEAVIVDPDVLDLRPLDEPAGPTPAELERERLEQAKREEERRVRQEQAEAEARAIRDAELKARQKAEAEAEARQLAEQKARQEAADEARRVAEQQARQEAEAEARRQAELKAKREAELKAKREAELKAKREAEEAARREAELKAQREAEAEAKRLAELKARQEAEAEAKRQAELKAKQEAAAMARRQAERRERLVREEQMRRAMGLETQRNDAVDNGLLAQYIAQIVAKVERNWNRPPSAKEGLSCKVRASQLPGGDVATVEVIECNGDAVVERSIQNAVFKASPLPEPADPTLFERNLVFIFEPK